MTVEPRRTERVTVTLDPPAGAVGSSTAGGFSFYEFSGDVVLTSPSDTLRVPYLLVPRSTTDVMAVGDLKVTKKNKAVDGEVSLSLKNRAGAFETSADFYTWGLEDKKDAPKSFTDTRFDLRAAGVQSFPDGDDQLMVFAVNTHTRWSNAAANEYDVLLDTNRDGEPDWIVFSADGGLVTAGATDGISQVFAYDIATGDTFATGFLASAPTDSSTILLPVYASDLGVTGAFSYTVQSFSSVNDGEDTIDGSATYDPWAPALSNGQFPTLQTGTTVPVAVQVNAAAFAEQKPLGVMVVVQDNAAGKDEALLVKAK